MGTRARTLVIIFSISTVCIASFFTWLILPLDNCNNDGAAKFLFYDNKNISFLYPSSLCVIEDYGYPVELSKNLLPVPSDIYYKNTVGSLREFFRMTVGLSSLNEIMEQRITFFFLSPPDNKKMLPHEYLRYLNKNDNFTTARNAQGTKYMKSFITPTNKGAAPYIKVAMLSDELKKIVFLTKGPKISEEEFYVVVDSFKFEE